MNIGLAWLYFGIFSKMSNFFETTDDFKLLFPVGVEVRCIGHFKLLFSLLRLTGANRLQQLALEVSIFVLNLLCR